MAGYIKVLTLVWSVITGLLTFLFSYISLGKWFTRKSKPTLEALGLKIPKSPLPSDRQGILDALSLSHATAHEDSQVIIQLLGDLKRLAEEHHRETHDRQRGVAAAVAAVIVPVIHDASADGRENVDRILRILPLLVSRGEKTDSQNRPRRRNSA